MYCCCPKSVVANSYNFRNIRLHLLRVSLPWIFSRFPKTTCSLDESTEVQKNVSRQWFLNTAYDLIRIDSVKIPGHLHQVYNSKEVKACNKTAKNESLSKIAPKMHFGIMSPKQKLSSNDEAYLISVIKAEAPSLPISSQLSNIYRS